MQYSLRVFLVTILLLCSALTAQAQKFYAQASSLDVEMGDNFQVGFTWENMDASNFQLPELKDFDIVNGPSTRSNKTLRNGRVTSIDSRIFTLRPKKPGRMKIGSASIRYKGQTYNTQPLYINVLKGQTSSIPIDKQIQARAEVTDSIVFIGQQILLEYKIYSLTGNFSSPQFQSMPTFDGFYAVNIPLNRVQTSTEKINGQDYYVQVFKRWALFPQQTGTYQIEPIQLNFQVEVLTKNGKVVVPKAEQVAAIDIQVQDLPPTLESQTGAVGRYKMTVKSNNRQTKTTDDAIVINMAIQGNGDPNQIIPPQWTLPDNLEMYDPNVTEGEYDNNLYGFSHYKNFEYLIVAKEPGTYNLEPSFTYYDTDSSAYVTLKQKLRPITVLQGSNMEDVAAPQAKKEITGIFKTTQLRSPSSSLHNSWIHLLGLASCLLGSIGIYFYGKQQEKSGKYDASTIKKNNAFSVAQTRLEKSKSHLDQNQSKEFHQEMIVALKTYLTDKHDIPALHLKKTELYDQLSSQISPTALTDFKTLTEKAELAMYAPVSLSNMSETYDMAIKFIEQVEA